MINTVFIPFPNLKTERLIFRQLNVDDKNEIFKLRSDESVNEFLDRPKANSIDDALQFIDKINGFIKNGESIMWAIVLKDDPKLIGTICLWNFQKENKEAEIGYELLPEFQGRKIMQEAIPKIIDYGFSVMNLRSIVAGLSADNIKSAALLEKNNFVRRPVEGENIADENMIEYILHRGITPDRVM